MHLGLCPVEVFVMRDPYIVCIGKWLGIGWKLLCILRQELFRVSWAVCRTLDKWPSFSVFVAYVLEFPSHMATKVLRKNHMLGRNIYRLCPSLFISGPKLEAAWLCHLSWVNSVLLLWYSDLGTFPGVMSSISMSHSHFGHLLLRYPSTSIHSSLVWWVRLKWML
jgi:hypothetical protein